MIEGAGVPRPAAGWPEGKHAWYGGDTAAVAEAVGRAAETVGADASGLEPHEIVIRDEHLEDEHIDDRLRKRGPDAQQIREARSKVRAYLDLLLREKGVDMTDDAYDALVNVAIHLIEESPKAE